MATLLDRIEPFSAGFAGRRSSTRVQALLERDPRSSRQGVGGSDVRTAVLAMARVSRYVSMRYRLPTHFAHTQTTTLCVQAFYSHCVAELLTEIDHTQKHAEESGQRPNYEAGYTNDTHPTLFADPSASGGAGHARGKTYACEAMGRRHSMVTSRIWSVWCYLDSWIQPRAAHHPTIATVR